MLIEFSGRCQHCVEEVKVLVLDGIAQDICWKCGKDPFLLRAVRGLIYIVKNPNQIGVKVGLTAKSLQQRLKSLNTTGVAGEFLPVAIFPSERPKYDETRVHTKLRSYSIAKEHFNLDPVEAALKAYRALNKRNPIFFDAVLEKRFYLRLEEDKIVMQRRLLGDGG